MLLLDQSTHHPLPHDQEDYWAKVAILLVLLGRPQAFQETKARLLALLNSEILKAVVSHQEPLLARIPLTLQTKLIPELILIVMVRRQLVQLELGQPHTLETLMVLLAQEEDMRCQARGSMSRLLAVWEIPVSWDLANLTQSTLDLKGLHQLAAISDGNLQLSGLLVSLGQRQTDLDKMTPLLLQIPGTQPIPDIAES
jgi:hypothetical protein